MHAFRSREKELYLVKKIFATGALLVLLTLTLVSCTVTGNTSPSTTGNTVGLSGDTFTPDSITIKKGASVTLANQANVVHIISNGSWQAIHPIPRPRRARPSLTTTPSVRPTKPRSSAPSIPLEHFITIASFILA